MEVITISGHAGSGKDTVGKMIAEHLEGHGKKVLITHYADLLKYVCEKFFNWDGKKNCDGRQLLQFIGTNVIREKNENFWVDFIVSMLKFFDTWWDWVIIPDLRFPNELGRLREAGFHVIHLDVVRINFDSSLSEEQMKHISETAMDGVIPDSYIRNDGGTPQLKQTVHKWIKENIDENKK